MTSVTNKRQQAARQRRQAILDAALEVFSAEGFAAARLDAIAERAGVAKGTIYLSFKDKEELFEQILVSAVMPVLMKVEALAATPAMTFQHMVHAMFEFFRAEVIETRRAEVIRLVLNEGRRFPKIAEIYHRQVISKGVEILGRSAAKARELGEPVPDELVEFPQLVFAPLLMALIWDGVFARLQPLDTRGLLDAHFRMITGAPFKTSSRDTSRES